MNKKCSFCNTSIDKVDHLIEAGPELHICGECVNECNNILAEEKVTLLTALDSLNMCTKIIRQTSTLNQDQLSIVEHAESIVTRGKERLFNEGK